MLSDVCLLCSVLCIAFYVFIKCVAVCQYLLLCSNLTDFCHYVCFVRQLFCLCMMFVATLLLHSRNVLIYVSVSCGLVCITYVISGAVLFHWSAIYVVSILRVNVRVILSLDKNCCLVGAYIISTNTSQ